jgi:hypothetical protein
MARLMTITLTRTGGPVTHDQPKHSPRWQGLKPTGRINDAGRPIPGDPIIINCRQTNPENCHESARPRSDCSGLCAACTENFHLVLSDVSLLLDDLDTALGYARFVEHGSRNGSPESSGGNRAITAIHNLTKAIMKAAGWFDANTPELVARGLLIHLHQLASLPETRSLALSISIEASRAHKVIDVPPEIWFYGACPTCEHDIWQERIRPDDDTPVTCHQRDCTYTAALDEHHRRHIEAGNDRWLTMDELVATVTKAGEVVTRKRIQRWRDHEGLPMETRSLAYWVDGELVTSEVEVFRLGDVRAFADGENLDSNAGTITSRQAAAQFCITEEAIRKLVERNQLTPIRRGAHPLRFLLAEIDRYRRVRSA